MEAEIWGSPEQRAVLARGEELYRLVRDDPRFCSHGRGVQLADPADSPEALDLLVSLTRLLGIGGCEMVPAEAVPAMQASLADRGLGTDVYVTWLGGAEAVERSRAVLAERTLPGDLVLRIIDRAAPRAWLDALAEVALGQEVLPSVGTALRGISRPGFGLVALDGEGRGVACASAVMTRHADHPDHGMAQWGQLATRDDRKGQGIARVLAARSIVQGAEALGMRVVSTGIREGNTPSENLCRSLGLVPSALCTVITIDPAMFSGDRATK